MADRPRALEAVDVTVTAADPAFWRGKRVLVTGHTGFKGGWLTLWLTRLGARVSGIALAPETTPSLFADGRIDRVVAASHFADIRDQAALAAILRDEQPDLVFHLAAQPLVRRGYADPVTTFATNVMGTVHLLEALRACPSLRAAVMVTTDKVYANREWPWPYREDDPLGGHDPYSASKAASEIAIAAYRDSFLASSGTRVATARAGNVIGGGDWSADRLLPDAIRAWQRGEALDVRRPGAVRPWQHVVEPLWGYMALGRRLWDGPPCAPSYNFGPSPDAAAPVRRVVELARMAWNGPAPVTWGDGDQGPHEAGLLALEIAQARRDLGVVPRLPLAVAIDRTIGWYRRHAAGAPAIELCHADIDAFEAAQ